MIIANGHIITGIFIAVDDLVKMFEVVQQSMAAVINIDRVCACLKGDSNSIINQLCKFSVCIANMHGMI